MFDIHLVPPPIILEFSLKYCGTVPDFRFLAPTAYPLHESRDGHGGHDGLPGQGGNWFYAGVVYQKFQRLEVVGLGCTRQCFLEMLQGG